MIENEELSKEGSEEQCGVILGLWDQEKTPTLIKDLEESVDLLETKCKKLLQELLYYKKYLEESQNLDLNFFTFKGKKNYENSPGISGSDPEIKFRKNLLNSQEFIETFEEKFQAKLLSINRELSNAADKIGLKDNIILINENYLKTFNVPTEEEIDERWEDVREEFIKANSLGAKAKSDPKITEGDEFSKITKNELKLYQKLSRLSFKWKKGKKRVKISSPVGRKNKFGCKRRRRKTHTRAVDSEEEVSVLKKKGKKMNSKSANNRKTKITVPVKSKKLRTYTSHSPRFRDSRSTISSLKKLRINDSEIETMCNSLVEAIHNKSSQQPYEKTVKENGLPDLGSIPKKTIPFTACTSTSKSYNIGMNIQQYLSLAKFKKKPDPRGQFPRMQKQASCSKISEPKEFGDNPKILLPRTPDRMKSDSFEVSEMEHKGNVWISKRCTSSDFRKVRSKYTGSSPESFMGYHKSTTRQYTNGQKSVIKSESKTAYAVGSKIMLSDCRRTDFFEIDKDQNLFLNESGDGDCNESCAKLKMEWSKVFGSFTEVYRKYTALKEKVSNNDSDHSDADLKSLEKEIDFAIDKYKEFLKFYSQFLHLRHRLKTLKIACEADVLGPVTSFSLNVHKKLNSCRPTYSLTMKKAFREIQALQEKIKLVEDY